MDTQMFTQDRLRIEILVLENKGIRMKMFIQKTTS